MTAEIVQAIKEKYFYYQDLEAKMRDLRQKQETHRRRIANLPPLVKPIVSFVDGFMGPKGHNKFMSWNREREDVFKETTALMKNNPGTYELTHVRYNAYTARDLIGSPEFSYGFMSKIDQQLLEKPFDQPILFWGNGILARRSNGKTPLIEVRVDEPPILYIPEHVGFVIKKVETLEVETFPDSMNAEKPSIVHAVWMPELTDQPRAIKIDEDAAIPWSSSEQEALIFTDTVEVANLQFR